MGYRMGCPVQWQMAMCTYVSRSYAFSFHISRVLARRIAKKTKAAEVARMGPRHAIQLTRFSAPVRLLWEAA
eukprot:3474616-Prymnesium_polylepis.1